MPENTDFQFGPAWYSGGGARSTDLLAQSAGRSAEFMPMLRQKAEELGIPESKLVEYLQIEWAQHNTGVPGQNDYIPMDLLAPFGPETIDKIERLKQLNPNIMKQFTEPYAQEPGALKYIADLGRGHLEQKVKQPYEKYRGPRIAEFSPPQQGVHQQIESLNRGNLQNNMRTRNALDTLAETRQGPGAMGAMQPYLDKGTSRIGQAERNPFVQSVRQNVLRPLQEEMTDNLMENILPRINANRIAAGNLYGGHRTELQGRALRDLNKMLMQESGKHLYQAQLHGQSAAEHERERAINAGQLAGSIKGSDIGRQSEMAQAEQGLMNEGQMRNLTALEALSNVGSQQQKMQQQKYDLDYEDYLRQKEGVMPEVERYNALVRGMPVPQTRSNFQPGVPEANIMSQLGGMGLMATGGLWGGKQKKAYRGGRIKLAGGGVASSLNLIKDRLRNLTFAPQSLAGQDVQDTMMDQMMPQDQPMPQDMGQMPQSPMAPPPPPAGPIERGSAGALSAMQKMQQQRDKMEQSAGEYESGAHDANPWGSALMQLGAGLAGSSPRLSERLAKGAEGAVAGFQHTVDENKKNEVISQNIRKSLLDTYQKEHENDVKQKHEVELEKLKAGNKSPTIHQDRTSGGFYTIGADGQMHMLAGSPAPVTQAQKDEGELKKLRQAEIIKSEQTNIDKLTETINKTQSSLHNYDVVLDQLTNGNIKNLIGPIKGKFYQKPWVQAFMKKTSVADLNAYTGATNKIVLDDVKAMGANPSNRDVKIVQDSKPSNDDTLEGAIRKAIINKSALQRANGYASFIKENWTKYGITSGDSAKAYNQWMQHNHQFSEDGTEILAPKNKPEDYFDDSLREKMGLPPKEESTEETQEGPESDDTPVATSSFKLIGKEDPKNVQKFAKSNKQKIMEALILRNAGS